MLDGAAALRCLASPVRQEIVDTLESLGGEASVALLAEALGKPADGLYYHLRQLTRAGVIEELAGTGQGQGRRYRSAAGAGARVHLRYPAAGPSREVQALDQVAGSLLRIARRDFAAALARPDTVTGGPARELWIARSKGWVSPAALTEVNRLLARLGELLNCRPDARRTRLVALAWVLAPIAASPVRRRRERQPG